jgi:hypothetical protein
LPTLGAVGCRDRDRLSLLNFIRRSWYPHDAVLGPVDQLKATTTPSAIHRRR